MAHPVPPEAGAPPVAAEPVAPAFATLPPRTYRELYSDAANNPRLDRTAEFLSGYRFTDIAGGIVPTPATLRDQTITLSDRQPMAFLALVTGQDGAYEVVVIHRMLRYMDAPGDDPSGLHERDLGLMGDILPHQYPTIEVPGTAFHLVTTAVRVPTVAAMMVHLPTWAADVPALGPYTEVDPETEVVRPRYIQLIPGRYASLLIHRRRIPPKQAYQEVVGAMAAQNDTDACQDVVTWLRAACTARGGGGAQTAIPSVIHAFTPLHLPPEAYRYVTSKVQADLPALLTAGGGGVAGADPAVAGALRMLGLAAEGGAAAPSARAPKTINEAYKETYPTLLRFCNAATSDGVAPVWVRLANCHKSEQQTVLTQEFQKVCMARGVATDLYTPVITTLLKPMITGFQFAGNGMDDLAAGCQPFLVSYAGSTDYYAALATASVGHQLSQGEQNASLSDYRTIREQEKVKFPGNFLEVYITLTRFAVLCQCLFQGAGAKHPFVEAMWATAVSVQNITPFATDRYNQLSRHSAIAVTYHARIVRAIQVSVQEYWQQVATNVADGITGIEVPNFQALLQELRRGTFHLSTNWLDIPETYLDPVATTTSMRGAAITIATPSVAATTVSGVTGSGSGVSSITNATTPVAQIENSTDDVSFTGITLRAGGTRNILREHRPPRNDAGNEFCVAWWTRRGCFPNCGRRSTHVPFASPGERERLLTYVQTHLQAPAAAAGT